MAVVGTALFVLLDAPLEKLRLTLGITLLAALIENIKKGRWSSTTYAVPKSLKSFAQLTFITLTFRALSF